MIAVFYIDNEATLEFGEISEEGLYVGISKLGYIELYGYLSEDDTAQLVDYLNKRLKERDNG